MANRFKVGWVHAIYALLERKWSQRQIAEALGIDRGTVARYARLASQSRCGSESEAKAGGGVGDADVLGDSIPARAPLGSAAGFAGDSSIPGDSKAAGAPPGSSDPDTLTAPASEGSPSPPVQPSCCEPFREIILAKLEQGLSGQRIYQDLVREHGFAARYHSVRRFVQRLGRASPLPFRRMECAPGEQAQVDFGKGAPVIQPNGKRKRPHVLRVVLSHSRKGYSEALWRQDTESFIRGLENAFHHFGGVPKTLVPDNLKAAVIQADWFDPDLNPKIQSFCEHYHTTILPTRPGIPRHKGKVERGVDYVQENGLKGLEFSSLQDENRHLMEWETSVADTRIHGTTRQQVRKLFEEVERPALQPLPLERFSFFHEAERIVNRDGHVEVDKAFYSVPPEFLGRKVWARWDSGVVRIFDHRFQQIAFHPKGEPGRFRTRDEHIATEKISGVERGAVWWLGRVGRIGPHAQRWAEAMLQVRGIQGIRVLMGLHSLYGLAIFDTVME